MLWSRHCVKFLKFSAVPSKNYALKFIYSAKFEINHPLNQGLKTFYWVIFSILRRTFVLKY